MIPKTNTYDIVLVDDNERARIGIRSLIDSDAQLRVVAEAQNGLEAILRTREYDPDLVLMDINMPNMDGFEATRIIKQEFPHIKIVMLSVSNDPTDFFEAIRNGAQGYLVKSLQPSDWISYLHGILNGLEPMDRLSAERLLAKFRSTSLSRKDDSRRLDLLTQREQEILEEVRNGATNREISARLFISENTVKNHLKNIMAKLNIHNRVQLATYSTDSANLDEGDQF